MTDTNGSPDSDPSSTAAAPGEPTGRAGRAGRLIALAIGVVAIAVAAGLFWFFNRDQPDKVNLDTAAAGVTTTTPSSTTAKGAGTTASGGTASGDIAGPWTIDTKSGTFDFESATGTFVGFRVKEELASIGSTEAVGRTGGVTGTMTIEGTKVTATDVTIDLTSITTNDSRRNSRVQQALETSTHPTATFKLTSPIDLGSDAASGSEVHTTAKGDLTIHGVTKPVTFDLDAKLVNGTVVVVGSTDVTFSDYGVEVPSSPIVLKVADDGTLELQLLFTRG